jgi:hypothetical protein
MPTNEYYCDVATLGPGLILMSGRFRVDGTNSPDLVVDQRPNVVSTAVAYTATGIYDVTLPKVGGGWPQELVTVLVGTSWVDATDAAVDGTVEARYQTGTYNPATGVFRILTVGSADGSAKDLAVGRDNSEISFIAILRKDKILGQTV